jgi:hypothetical protein
VLLAAKFLHVAKFTALIPLPLLITDWYSGGN